MEIILHKNYTFPVKQLLTHSDCLEISNDFSKWPNYLELGFTEEHIPQLIQMATDDDLNCADSESLEVWAPAHAWRTLGQLRAEEAIKPLLNILLGLDGDEWIGEELPYVYGMIGAKAIPTLADYLAEESNSIESRITASFCLERIGNMQPETRADCVSVLTQQLEKFTANDPELNGFFITYLCDLKAVESLPSIKKAYEKECVDYTIQGDYEDIEIDLGVRKKRATPANYPTIFDKYPGLKQFAQANQQNTETNSQTSLDKSPGLKQVAPTNQQNTQPVVRKNTKTGRNDPCPCGSGKKYKKCCLATLVA